MNQTNDTELIMEEIDPWAAFSEKDYLLIFLYIPIILVALVANLSVIIIVIQNRHMRRISNYFLINLSIADLLVTLVCMPNAMWRAYTMVYNFGQYTCKISAFLECISVGTSIFTITAMAIHRYIAITNPLFGRLYFSLNRCSTILFILGLWLLSAIVFSPVLWVYNITEEILNYSTNNNEKNITIHLCREEDWKNIIIPQHLMGILWFMFVFAIPGVIMLFAYCTMGVTLCSDTLLVDGGSHQRNRLIQSRKKVACILLLLAFVFAICWLPKHILNLLHDTSSDRMDNDLKVKAQQYLLLLGHLNSALNPVIYCALSKTFRTSIIKLFCKRTCSVQNEITRVTMLRLQNLRIKPNLNSRSATQTNDNIEKQAINESSIR